MLRRIVIAIVLISLVALTSFIMLKWMFVSNEADRMTSDEEERHPMGAVVYDERFRKIVDVFRANLADGQERSGAAFAVYWKGAPVVHVWGGWAVRPEDRRLKIKDQTTNGVTLQGVPWDEHTMSVLFSTTKCLSALVLAWVLQQTDGEIDYETKVVKVWPEYGKHGKHNTTIGQVALHSAGVPYGARSLTRKDVRSHEILAKWFEDAPPVWEPGSKSGYHALTIGLLIDQIVRRIDPYKRGVWRILDEDLLQPNGIDELSIGLRRPEDNDRVAVLSGPDEIDRMREAERNPESLRRYDLGDNEFNTQLNKVFEWILPTSEDYNKLENRLISMPSNMGIGNAASFAKLLSLVSTGKILSEKTLSKISGPILEEEMDEINQYEESKGYGFQYTRSPKGEWIFGHSGLGGQNVRVDHHEQLSFVYLCNGMKIADADLVEPWRRLVDALYKCIE